MINKLKIAVVIVAFAVAIAVLSMEFGVGGMNVEVVYKQPDGSYIVQPTHRMTGRPNGVQKNYTKDGRVVGRVLWANGTWLEADYFHPETGRQTSSASASYDGSQTEYKSWNEHGELITWYITTLTGKGTTEIEYKHNPVLHAKRDTR